MKISIRKDLILPIIIIISGILLSSVLLYGSIVDASNETDSISNQISSQNVGLKKINLEIENMFCIGCRANVINSVKGLDGVIQADADPRTSTGWVIYDSEKTNRDTILNATVFNAYPVKFVSEENYTDEVNQSADPKDIPNKIQSKLEELAKLLKEKDVKFEKYFQDELDDAINGEYWDKANNLLDNYISSYK